MGRVAAHRPEAAFLNARLGKQEPVYELPRLVADIAAEIKAHDFSDSPYRLDRAGHRREDDRGWQNKPRLSDAQTEAVRTQVMWVVGQALGYAGLLRQDEVYVWAEACGVKTTTPSGKPRSGHILHGFRFNPDNTFDGPRNDFLGLEDVLNESNWTGLDYADEETVDLAQAAALFTHWLSRRGVKKVVTEGQMSGYLNPVLMTEGDPETTTYPAVELGNLRIMFDKYWDQWHTAKDDDPWAAVTSKKPSEVTWADLSDPKKADEPPF